MVLIGSAILFIVLTGMLYALGVNVWLGPKAVIDRVSGEGWGPHETVHPSLAFHDILHKLGNMVPASGKDMNVLQKRLARAGIREPSALKILYGIKALLLVTLPVVTFLVLTRFDFSANTRAGLVVMAAGLGFFGPNRVVESLIKRRRKNIRKGLPNARVGGYVAENLES